MRRSFKIILFFIFIVLSLGTCFILSNRHNLGSLFEFSVVDVMSLLSSIIIGFGLTYLVSVAFPNENKKNEIIEESLSSVKEDFTYLMQQLVKNRNIKITDNFRTYILLVSKNIDKDISILNDLCENKNHMKKAVGELINCRRNFNYLLTGDNLTAGQSVTDTYIEECSNNYYLLKQYIFKCKLELYNV